MNTLKLLAVVSLLILTVPAAAQDAPPAQPPGPAAEDIQELKDLLARQQELIEKLTEELRETKQALESLEKEKTAAEPVPAEPAPPVEGKITEVRMDRKLVLIDIGSANGLKEGDIFEVSRAGTKMGRIKVCVVVDKDLANAEVIEAQAELIPGDMVTRIAAAPEAPPSPAETVIRPVRSNPNLSPEPELPRTEAQKLGKRLDMLEDLCADLAKQVERLQSRLENNTKVAAEQTVRKSAPVAPEEPKRLAQSARVEAKIADVTDKHVYIWAGEEQGVKEGDTFLITRGEREVATVKVTKIIEDMCKAEIVSKTTEIRKKDLAVLQ